MSAFTVRSGSVSVQGNFREKNEDRVGVYPDLGLFLVADGMGGQQAGEKASQMAIDIIPGNLESKLPAGQSNDHVIAEAIRNAVLQANNEILALSSLHTEFKNMGTTCVLALVKDASVYIAGIGDSRAYLLRSDVLKQLTVDHSLAQALVDAGTIAPEEADTHRFRNILWKYLGSKDVGEGPDVKIIDALPGDRCMLASDGLTGKVAEEEIQAVLSEQEDPQVAAENLVQLALDYQTRDNVSCVTMYLE